MPAGQYVREPIHFYSGDWPRLVWQANYLEDVAINPHGCQISEGMVELYFGPFGPTRAIGRTVADAITSPDFGTEHFHHNDFTPNVFYDRAVRDIAACYHNGTACRLDAKTATVGTSILLNAYESARLGVRIVM